MIRMTLYFPLLTYSCFHFTSIYSTHCVRGKGCNKQITFDVMLIHHLDDAHYLTILEKPIIICDIEPRFPFQYNKLYKQAEPLSKTIVLEEKNLLKQ